ncbi:MAG TPA: efflux RND transporter permease subunit, partial [Pelovirga sp.]|nr:efflux RND transporter permease subunit [Pelovirga sp.]
MNSIIAWFARNHVAANLLMALIIGLGLWAVTDRIPMEVFPEFERDTVIISAVYRGATPAEVEEAVIIRIEEAIAAVTGIDTIISTANEGSGQVRVDVLKGYKPREIMDDIRNKVNAISTFPEEVERPTYEILEFRREVISVVVGANLPEGDLRRIGEMVRDDLTALSAISLADLVAVRPYELSVEVNQATLEQYQLSLEDLSQAIRSHSLDLPAGAIKTRGGEILLRTMGQADTAADYARIPVRATPTGSQLLLGDIATIRDGFDEEPLEAVLNKKAAVMIEVYRTGEQNALDVGRAVREYVEEKREILPPGVSIDYWRDRSRIVQLRLNTLTSSALQGGILIFLALALFLRFSVAVWVCIGIPISFFGALALMPTLGVTLNSLSLFAFILVLGIVVDDAIITGENVYRRLKEDGESIEGIIAGTQEVAVPVTFGLLTTIAAFTPLLFMEGVRGPIFAQIPLIVIPALAFSWVESKLILPAHLSSVHITKPPRGGLLMLQKLQQKVANGLEWFTLQIYQPVLELAVK